MGHRLAPKLTAEERLRAELLAHKEIMDVIEKVRNEQMEVDRHFYTGVMMTICAYVLRSQPYGWSADKSMRFLERISGILNDLANDTIHISDLVRETEKKGIRIVWNAKREYITDISIFEEQEDVQS